MPLVQLFQNLSNPHNAKIEFVETFVEENNKNDAYGRTLFEDYKYNDLDLLKNLWFTDEGFLYKRVLKHEAFSGINIHSVTQGKKGRWGYTNIYIEKIFTLRSYYVLKHLTNKVHQLLKNIFNGLPQPESLPYSMSKKMIFIASQAYKKQYALNSISVIPSNIYGKFDNFNLKSSHVMPALIRKFYEAKLILLNFLVLCIKNKLIIEKYNFDLIITDNSSASSLSFLTLSKLFKS